MKAEVLEKFSIAGYTVLKLDRDIPNMKIGAYLIEGERYRPVPCHYHSVDGRPILNMIAVEGEGPREGTWVEFLPEG